MNNNSKKYSGFIIAGVVLIILLLSAGSYNSLVKKDEKVKLQWNEVQNAYQRRLDLIPNIVNVVKGVSNYEKDVLTQISEARANAAKFTNTSLSVENANIQTQTQNQLAGAANRLIISLEKYPELRGTQAYKDLQTQLEGTERRIKVARKDFNLAVADYNSSVRSFPKNMFAGIFGFSPKSGFQSDSGADIAQEIKF